MSSPQLAGLMKLRALAVNPLSLAAEVVARLGCSTLLNKHQSLSDLVDMATRWLAHTEATVLVPLWNSVWESPGAGRRRVLEGLTHVVGSVDGGEMVVGYCRSVDNVGVWRLETGLMVHQFNTKHHQQQQHGLIVAHHGAFIITACYSPETRSTRLQVLSTELGLRLLSLTLPRQLGALVLSHDDRLLVISSVSTVPVDEGGEPVDSVNLDRPTRHHFGEVLSSHDLSAQVLRKGGELTRSIIGFDLNTRDVVFRLPLVDLHNEGISQH